VPTFDDVPDEFESILIEDGNGPGPYGAKELGEGGIIPVAPAVANAVAWSAGARVKSLLFTPERIRRAIKDVPHGAPGEFKPMVSGGGLLWSLPPRCFPAPLFINAIRSPLSAAAARRHRRDAQAGMRDISRV
jgi:hypothetical protein